jgi:hypothetical protein
MHCRDKYYVHTDLEEPVAAVHPYTTVMMNTALEMRRIVHDVFLNGEYDDIGKNENYRRYARSYMNGNEHLSETWVAD